ncbi:hypothetical protein CBR_g27837 [Chara braunii]|uniref:ATP-dependent DNA helicase n=1 Tax=Chara braunii TaxID=69332 RepID=A0A388L8G5_CHABU|nr:hypothetical protein CBR_g27837 [Chara braunii]|eukprot:GBG78611.1 hypothetical protein CBR_g27837 [Chara braunii]
MNMVVDSQVDRPVEGISWSNVLRQIRARSDGDGLFGKWLADARTEREYLEACGERYEYGMASQIHDMEQCLLQRKSKVPYGIAGKVPNDSALKGECGRYLTDNEGLRWTQDELLGMLKKKEEEVTVLRSAFAKIEVNARSVLESFLERKRSEECLVLFDLDRILHEYGKNIRLFGLYYLTPDGKTIVDNMNRHYENRTMSSIINDELSYDPIEMQTKFKSNFRRLWSRQRALVQRVIRAVEEKQPLYAFVDAPAGTGKTFCIKTILAGIRSRNGIGLAVASSGIAATLFTNGRTFHSRFRAPLKLDNTRPFNIPKQSDLAELIRRADLIVWDEALMSNKFHLEALDITLQDVCNSNLPFGGKVLLFSGDFRQVLPVMKHWSRAQQIDASIKMSPLWKLFEVHCLTENMRILSLGDDAMTGMYGMFFMRIGNGDHIRFVPNEHATVKLPHEICTDKPIRDLISWTFEDVCEHVNNVDYFYARLILCATNDDAGCVNDMVLNDFPGEVLRALRTIPTDVLFNDDRDPCLKSQRGEGEGIARAPSQTRNCATIVEVPDDSNPPPPVPRVPHPRTYLSQWFDDAKKVGLRKVLNEIFFKMFVKTATVVKDERIWEKFLDWQRTKLTNMCLERGSSLPSNPLNISDVESCWMFQSLLHDEYIALSNEEIVRMTFDLPYCLTDETIPKPFFRYARIQSLIKRVPVGVASSAPPSTTVRPLSLPAPSPANCQRLADYASSFNVGTPIVTASTVVSASPAAMFTPSPAPCVVPAPVSPAAQLHVRIGGLPEVTPSTFDIAVYESLASVGPKKLHAHLSYLDSSHRLQDIAQAADELHTDMNTWRSVDAAIHLDYHRQRQSRFQTFEDYRRKVLQQSSVRDMLREFRSTNGS